MVALVGRGDLGDAFPERLSGATVERQNDKAVLFAAGGAAPCPAWAAAPASRASGGRLDRLLLLAGRDGCRQKDTISPDDGGGEASPGDL